MKANIKFLIDVSISKFRLFPTNQMFHKYMHFMHHSDVHVLSYCMINNISR